MHWYNGNIAEAVQRSKSEGAIFFVAIFGDDDSSKNLEKTLDAEEIQAVISSMRLVSIRLTSDSQEHLQFKQIYANANSPCLYFISGMGSPIEVVHGEILTTGLKEKFEAAWLKHNEIQSQGQKPTPQNPVESQASPRASSTPRDVPLTGASSSDGTGGDGDKVEATEDSPENNSEAPLTLEQKIERARQLAAAKAKLKLEKEAEEARQREKQRREDGKGVAELKRWQDEQETKRALEERKRQRDEDKEYRKKLLEQIAKDRAERFFNNPPITNEHKAEAGPSSFSQPAPPANYTGKARLQFRMPNGSSQTHTFEKDVTLDYVRNFLITGQHVTLRKFSLCIGYPRREFTTAEYTQTLTDLGLIPSATLLVIPVSSHSMGGVTGATGIWTFFTALLDYLFYPLTFLLGLFQSALPAITGSATSQTSAHSSSQADRDNHGSSAVPGSSTQGRGTRPVGKTDSEQSSPGHSKDLRKRNVERKSDGNIHRLKQENDSSDDDGTWNGNSTQQKPR